MITPRNILLTRQGARLNPRFLATTERRVVSDSHAYPDYHGSAGRRVIVALKPMRDSASG